VRSLESVLTDFSVQRLGGYAEDGRSATLVPAHVFEDVPDVDPLQLLERGDVRHLMVLVLGDTG
jgi:hypothetical protein